MWITPLDNVAASGYVMTIKSDTTGNGANEVTNLIEVQMNKQGPGTIWSINVKVNGRCVECVTYGSKREARTALITITDKYR